MLSGDRFALRCVTRVGVFLPRTCHDKNILQKKSVITQTFLWRRKRDLNPRDAFTPYSLSRGAPSPLGYFSVCIKLKVSQTAKIKMAERVGFEPTDACTSPVFKTGALNQLDHLSSTMPV